MFFPTIKGSSVICQFSKFFFIKRFQLMFYWLNHEVPAWQNQLLWECRGFNSCLFIFLRRFEFFCIFRLNCSWQLLIRFSSNWYQWKDQLLHCVSAYIPSLFIFFRLQRLSKYSLERIFDSIFIRLRCSFSETTSPNLVLRGKCFFGDLLCKSRYDFIYIEKTHDLKKGHFWPFEHLFKLFALYFSGKLISHIWD